VDVDGTGDGEEDGAQSEDIENEEADADDANAAAADVEAQSDSAPVTDETAAKTVDADASQPSTSAGVDNPKDQESAVRI